MELATSSSPATQLGFEEALARLAGLRVGIVCNPASVDRDLVHVVDRLEQDPQVTLAAVFGPQHGFRADVQDNMVETPHGLLSPATPRAGPHERPVPVYSLYSETREPTAEMLSGLDVLVVDLQDVGTRVYTFVYTMANCLRAGRRHGVPVIVCDRPNPIGGRQVEGPVLESGFESFVGQFPIPLRHGMTIAELARLFNDSIGADLSVEPMAHWSRDQYFDDTGLPWVMPSPNMPTLDTAVVYPGTVLLEGTNASEGRGTTRPFEIVGAPWVSSDGFVKTLEACGLPGVRFRPTVFEPTFQKHAGTACGGCQIHVTDRTGFRPVATGLAVLAALRQDAPHRADSTPRSSEGFAWKQPPYEYEHRLMPIDCIAGTDALRRQVEQRVPLDEIVDSWKARLDPFLDVRRAHLLY